MTSDLTQLLTQAARSLNRGQPDAAESQLVPIKDRPEAWHLMGHIRNAQGRPKEAEDYLVEAGAASPQDADVRINLGKLYLNTGRSDQAVTPLLQAAMIKQHDVAALVEIGLLVRQAGRAQEAFSILWRHFELGGHVSSALAALCEILMNSSENDKLEAVAERLLAREPNHPTAVAALATVAQRRGEYDEIAGWHRDYARRLQDPSTIGLCLFCHTLVADYDGEPLKRLTDELLALLPEAPKVDLSHIPMAPDKQLRLGLLSREVASTVSLPCLLPLTKQLSKHMSVLVFSTAPLQGEAVDHWRRDGFNIIDVHAAAPKDIARTIRDNGIDVLLDISGYSQSPHIFALRHRPAPVTATYYFASLGIDETFYRATSPAFDVPEDVAGERGLKGLQTHMVFPPPPEGVAATPAPMAQAGTPVFGSFNALPKLNTATMALWAATLDAVPGASMLIKAPELARDEERERFLQRIISAGIDPARVELMGGRLPRDQFEALFAKIDVMLDAFPFTSALTAHDALARGVPVVTLRGKGHAARVCAEFLGALNLQQCIADSAEEYVKIASGLVADAERLNDLRFSLPARLKGSSLVDVEGTGDALYSALRSAWRDVCGLAPNVGS